MKRLCALAVWLCVQGCTAWAQGTTSAAESPANLAVRRAEVRAQQAALRERLAALQQDIAAQDAQRRDLTQALKASESAISDLTRELGSLRAQSDAAQADLNRARDGIVRQSAVLEQRRQALAAQLRARYVSGSSAWTALLGADDPYAIGRNLGYWGYVARAQTQAVHDVQQSLDELTRLRAQATQRQVELDDLTGAARTRVDALRGQQGAQQRALQEREAALRARRMQADELLRDVQGLENLVSRLETEIGKAQTVAPRRELPGAPDGQNGRNGQGGHGGGSASGSASGSGDLSGLDGLRGKLPYPVQGQVVGRFGLQRPEGGLWRGVVIRAEQGTPVQAVASGRVVYASWLTGFGNLLIVDHGAQYLTVYAYNQSLLHAVGDTIRQGETLALAGSTGGQIEPGLYFEIRHKGAPVNPQLWLQP